MPRHNPNQGLPADWMELAISDLTVAKVRPEGLVRFESLCFLAQQAAEKALKAVCRHHGIRFDSTHDIDELMSLLDDHGHSVPEAHDEATILTRYAVQTRYPSL